MLDSFEPLLLAFMYLKIANMDQWDGTFFTGKF